LTGSAVFAGLTIVTNRQTDRQTNKQTTLLGLHGPIITPSLTTTHTAITGYITFISTAVSAETRLDVFTTTTATSDLSAR